MANTCQCVRWKSSVSNWLLHWSLTAVNTFWADCMLAYFKNVAFTNKLKIFFSLENSSLLLMLFCKSNMTSLRSAVIIIISHTKKTINITMQFYYTSAALMLQLNAYHSLQIPSSTVFTYDGKFLYWYWMFWLAVCPKVDTE